MNKRPLDSHSEKRVTKSYVYSCMHTSNFGKNKVLNTFPVREILYASNEHNFWNTPKQHRTTRNTAEPSGTFPRQPRTPDISIDSRLNRIQKQE